ncbi:hypothetical protein FPANT_7525 [Fusarium pseudoanthophilum]|uniref:Uncharacterized protein n=1 Tax=Fusarium pseudoanthophilum TaxID=48495 RepID=A0A8H5L5M8_9HYPO|nr:hypothetical protein FPANT_7525 [Fusarium pseudoanthophilum]
MTTSLTETEQSVAQADSGRRQKEVNETTSKGQSKETRDRESTAFSPVRIGWIKMAWYKQSNASQHIPALQHFAKLSVSARMCRNAKQGFTRHPEDPRGGNDNDLQLNLFIIGNTTPCIQTSITIALPRNPNHEHIARDHRLLLSWFNFSDVRNAPWIPAQPALTTVLKTTTSGLYYARNTKTFDIRLDIIKSDLILDTKSQGSVYLELSDTARVVYIPRRHHCPPKKRRGGGSDPPETVLDLQLCVVEQDHDRGGGYDQPRDAQEVIRDELTHYATTVASAQASMKQSQGIPDPSKHYHEGIPMSCRGSRDHLRQAYRIRHHESQRASMYESFARNTEPPPLKRHYRIVPNDVRLPTQDPVEDQRGDTGVMLVVWEHKSIPIGEDGSKKYSAEMPGTYQKWPFVNELKFAAPPNVHSCQATSVGNSYLKTLCKSMGSIAKLYITTNLIENDAPISTDVAAETDGGCNMEQRMHFPTHNGFLDHYYTL